MRKFKILETKKWWAYALMLMMPMLMANCSDDGPNGGKSNHSLEREYIQGDNLVVNLNKSENIKTEYMARISNLTDSTAVLTLSTQPLGDVDDRGLKQYASLTTVPLLPGTKETSQDLNIKISKESDTVVFQTHMETYTVSCEISGSIAYDKKVKKPVMTLDLSVKLQPDYEGRTISDSGYVKLDSKNSTLTSDLEYEALYTNILYAPVFRMNGSSQKDSGIIDVYKISRIGVNFWKSGFWMVSMPRSYDPNYPSIKYYAVVTFPILVGNYARIFLDETWFCDTINPLIGFYRFTNDKVFEEYAKAMREAVFPVLPDGIKVRIAYYPAYTYYAPDVELSDGTRSVVEASGNFWIEDDAFLKIVNKVTIDFITANESRMEEVVAYLKNRCGGSASEDAIREAIQNLKKLIYRGEFSHSLRYNFSVTGY